MERKIKRRQPPRDGVQYITAPAVREELNPFVFFDAGAMTRRDDGLRIGLHPHSGIGIITYFEGGDLVHGDSARNDGVVRDGGVQWIQAGGGIWHEESYRKKADGRGDPWRLAIHQLWLQLPPELEEGEPAYQNVQPEDLPVVDNIKIIAGTYGGASSPLKVPFDLTYLDVGLAAGAEFAMPTPPGQTTGFIFPRAGSVELHGDEVPPDHLTVLEDNEGELVLRARRDAALVLVTAAPQHRPMVVEGGSIHSNEAALKRSIERIRRLR